MRSAHLRNDVCPHAAACKPRSLARGLALALGVSGNFALATTFVTSCADDGGAGTLRAVLAAAVDGETIDAYSQAQCSTITLTQGEIPVPASVTVLGPSSGTLTIDAGHNGRIFHSTAATAADRALTLTALLLTGGRASSGGCVDTGQLTLQNSIVTDCIATDEALVKGGALLVDGAAYLRHSRIEGSQANSTGDRAYGGGIYAGSVHCYDSTISGNSTSSPAIDGAAGLEVTGYFYAARCTIDSNTGRYVAGIFQRLGATENIVMFNSTVSGNRATGAGVGAIASGGPKITLWNTTVAFNSSALGCSGIENFVGDVFLFSSIAANNEGGQAGCSQVISDNGLVGYFYSLVSSASGPVPDNSLVADPQLTPLADHGGPTRTHGLSASSPAIDHGDNVYELATDQRGAGFAREVSAITTGVFATDIGAFERQMDDDELFYGGF
jgi:hypothetical protein